jgi:RNA-binding protein
MGLTDEQSHYLRILGHDLQPVADVGAGGVTNSLIKQIDRALAHHELVKVRVPFGDKRRRSKVIDELAPLAQAHLVQRASNCCLLYRPADEPTIRLPTPR